MEEKKNKLYCKWWFWVIILTIVIVLCFTAVMFQGFKYATSGISGVALQVQSIYNDCTLYASSGENTLILEYINGRQINDEQLDKISKIIKENANTTFNNYSKFIVITHLEKDNNHKLETVSIQEFSLPDFQIISTKSYIDFKNYQELFSTYENTMNNYKDLYNYIF